MKVKARRFVPSGVLALACLTLAFASHAALIVYEGFNYPVGSALPGQNGGTGWMGGWIGPNLGGTAATSMDLPLSVANARNWTNWPGAVAGFGGPNFDQDHGW